MYGNTSLGCSLPLWAGHWFSVFISLQYSFLLWPCPTAFENTPNILQPAMPQVVYVPYERGGEKKSAFVCFCLGNCCFNKHSICSLVILSGEVMRSHPLPQSVGYCKKSQRGGVWFPCTAMCWKAVFLAVFHQNRTSTKHIILQFFMPLTECWANCPWELCMALII